jgi:multidrug efflux pump subunit AcrB
MTAFSTVMGILPIAIGLGASAGARRPLGVAVVLGMMASTFLTLVIVPVVYILIAPRQRAAVRTTATPSERQEPAAAALTE